MTEAGPGTPHVRRRRGRRPPRLPHPHGRRRPVHPRLGEPRPVPPPRPGPPGHHTRRRRTVRGHIALGHSIRYCLGASLARLPCEATLGALLARYPDLPLPYPRPAWHGGSSQARLPAPPNCLWRCSAGFSGRPGTALPVLPSAATAGPVCRPVHVDGQRAPDLLAPQAGLFSFSSRENERSVAVTCRRIEAPASGGRPRLLRRNPRSGTMRTALRAQLPAPGVAAPERWR